MMESGYENLVLRFELFGKGIQNLDYGLSGVDFRLFDISIELGKYVDFYQFCTIAEQLQLPIVPILTIGNFDRESIYGLAERNSVIYPEQVSEGVVIRSIEEHPAPNIPRKILKLVSKRFAVKDTEGEKLDE
jgi:ATP-dependent RNA circularization protein (DNA/RNA ligase family)